MTMTMHSTPADKELIKKSAKHFLGWCERNGYVAQPPNVDLSEAQGGSVTLRNAIGILATYRFDALSNRMRPYQVGAQVDADPYKRIH